MDRDGSGTLDFDEFLFALRPPLNNNRKSLIQKAFRYIKTKCRYQDSNLEPFDSEMVKKFDVFPSNSYITLPVIYSRYFRLRKLQSSKNLISPDNVPPSNPERDLDFVIKTRI